MEVNIKTNNLQRLILNLVVLVFTTFFFLDFTHAWWNSSYVFYQDINISTSSGSTPQNYTVKIILNSSNVGSGFDWSNECSINKTRARIVDETNSFELPLWVRSCSSSGENMTLWTKVDNNITTSGYIAKLYYGNTLSSFISDANNTFDFYLNFSAVTIVSEGSGQDQSGGNEIQDSGTTYYGYGNSWKVAIGFDTFTVNNDGSQILELDMRSDDCGEISALKFDTNTGQEDTFNYRWCGSQTNWGIVPDTTYSESTRWEEVSSVLNDFTSTFTHIHLVTEDDGGSGSSNTSYKHVRIRKYVATEPTFSIGSENTIDTIVSSLNPSNNTIQFPTSISLTCNVATSNSTTLRNVSLYGNWSGSGWHLNQTNNISGLFNSSTFIVNLPSTTQTYKWNCNVFDQAGFSDWFDSNYTFTIDRTPPIITINSPSGTINDVTPVINISSSKAGSLWYNIDGGSNISLCDNCNFSDNIFSHLAEGTYTLNVFANDTVGNFNNISTAITVDTNFRFDDNFNDNSSLDNLSLIQYNQGNITYAGAKSTYEGIEYGVLSSSITWIAQQWGGSFNDGEVDVSCPGGDSNCWFITQNGTNISTPNIRNGVTTLDSDPGTVGFVMYSEENVRTRFSGMNSQQSDHFVAVCYIASQWYIDDNNGCNEAFTPRGSDILVADLVMGVFSVSEKLANATGIGQTTFKAINTSYNIQIIENVSWVEINSDANNTIEVNISLDGGNTWYNTTNGQGIANVTANSSLIIKISMNGEQGSGLGISNFTIIWDAVIAPSIDITNPINNSKIIVQGGQLNITWELSDNEDNLTCIIFIDGLSNGIENCSSIITNSLLFNFSRGLHNISIRVNDSENNSVNSSPSYFNIIYDSHSKINKTITSVSGSNMYLVELNISNLLPADLNITPIDFVDSNFGSGSFSPIFDWFNIITGIYDGTIFGWNLTISGQSSRPINYSIVKNNNESRLIDQYIIGLY